MKLSENVSCICKCNVNSVTIENNIKNELEQCVDRLLCNSSEINAESLEEIFFPDIPNIDIFLSHSHKDEELAKRLASWINSEFKLNVFIDSQVWGDKNNLIKKFSSKYLKFCDSCPNIVTAVDTILNIALLKMMDKAECLIFLNTSSSITYDDFTYSPWIYSEMEMSRKLRCVIPQRLCVKTRNINFRQLLLFIQDINVPSIKYHLNLMHLEPLTCSDLQNWEQLCKNQNGINALDCLYKNFSKKGFGCNCLGECCIPCDFYEIENTIIDYINKIELSKEGLERKEVEFYKKLGSCLRDYDTDFIRDLGFYLKYKYGNALNQSNLLDSKRFSMYDGEISEYDNWRKIRSIIRNKKK